MAVTAINVSPTSGATIARLDALSFRALYDDLGSIVVAVTYPASGRQDGRREVVFSGGAFAPVFAFASSCVLVGDGLGADFVVRRTGGWDEAPTLDVTEAAETIPGWGYPWGGG